jgi:hypothetical protein
MADSKISELPSGAPAQASDEYIVARGSANYKLTLTNIAASMAPIGATTPNSGAFTTLSASSTVSGAGFTSYLASPPAIGGTAPNTGAFTTLSASGAASFADGTSAAPAITNTGDTNTGVYFPAADEVAVAAGGSVAAAFNGNGVFFRNRVINGDMRIDQRNAGAAVTIGSAGNLVYTLDRWAAYCDQNSKFSVQQTPSGTGPAGFPSYLAATSLSAYTVGASEVFGLQQTIEGLNVSDLGWGTASARTVTLSFQVYSSLTGTFGGALRNGSNNRSYPFSYTISAANTWTPISITIAGDTSGTWLTNNNAAIRIWFSLGAGSTFSGTAGAWAGANYLAPTGAVSIVGTNGATFYITGVQLETGSVATPFERRPYGTELMLCQRYFYRQDGSTGSFAFHGQGLCYSSTTGGITLVPPVTLRTNPTVTANAGSFAVQQANGNMEAVTGLTFPYSGPLFVYADFTTAGNLVAGASTRLLRNSGNTATSIAMSAEL